MFGWLEKLECYFLFGKEKVWFWMLDSLSCWIGEELMLYMRFDHHFKICIYFKSNLSQMVGVIEWEQGMLKWIPKEKKNTQNITLLRKMLNNSVSISQLDTLIFLVDENQGILIVLEFFCPIKGFSSINNPYISYFGFKIIGSNLGAVHYFFYFFFFFFLRRKTVNIIN